MPMTDYVGRFAPSPTGPLHFGSLVAGVASYLDAHAHHGSWLIRIEDLDPPREIAGSTDLILRALDIFGLHSQEDIVYQSHRDNLYQALCEQLLHSNDAFYCQCSRSQLKATLGLHTHDCSNAQATPANSAIRLRSQDCTISYHDRIQGLQSENIRNEVGDFVIKRKDGLFAYQLAMVLDDHLQGITHIVRGSDLLDSSCRQIYLQKILNFKQPTYAHIPVINNIQGQKLSKQNLAPALDLSAPSKQLFRALQALNMHPDSSLIKAQPSEQLSWAQEHWDISNIPKTMSIEEQLIS